jgi:hypothetical protein
MWTETATGYSTSDPSEIAAFLEQQKTKKDQKDQDKDKKKENTTSQGGVPENLRRCGMCHNPNGIYYDQLAGYREAFWMNVSAIAGLAFEGLSAFSIAARGVPALRAAYESEVRGLNYTENYYFWWLYFIDYKPA